MAIDPPAARLRPGARRIRSGWPRSGPGAKAVTVATGARRAPRDDDRAVATSPAVGIFQPRSSARAGTRVRAGDRIGTVDMLGVPQEVVAPTDGVVGASLVEPGDAVEYGQGLVVIEFASAAPVARRHRRRRRPPQRRPIAGSTASTRRAADH